jgi:hypothetical protein
MQLTDHADVSFCALVPLHPEKLDATDANKLEARIVSCSALSHAEEPVLRISLHVRQK